MSPQSRVLWSALLVTLMGAALPPGSARAQSYELARQSLGLSPDPIERSPRLLGLGRLTLVAPDDNNRINLWDFAGNPAGVFEDDSVSTLSFRPMSASTASVSDASRAGLPIERQDLAAREVRIGYEAWRRHAGSSAFGAFGDVGQLRLDTPFSSDVERRSQFARPNVTTIVNGRMPYFAGDRVHYALTAHYGFEKSTDDYRLIRRNAAGQYLDQNGQLIGPPDIFTPDDIETQSQGAGVALSYRAAKWATLAIAADGDRAKIKSENSGVRYDSERSETRPHWTGQGSLIVRVGSLLEWGSDVRSWTSKSDERWAFSISTNSGGAGAVPLVGRGDLLDRAERGAIGRSRVRLAMGPWEMGASIAASTRRVTVTPRLANGQNTFNAFLDDIYYRTRGDTTAFSDSIVYNRTQTDAWEGAGGISWQMPGRRGVIGVEYHQRRAEFEQTLSGTGPRQLGWDARAGIEYRCNPVLTGRAGYIYGWDDADDFTRQNERVANAVTTGFGYRPAGATWSLESGYVIQWYQADFGSPATPRGTQQQIAAQLQWTF
jgi:hypothetical protein